LAESVADDRYVYTRFVVAVPHASISVAYRLIDPPAVLLADQRYGEVNQLSFDVRRSKADEFALGLRARRLEFERL
jgi:hypothetical protein